MPMLEKTAHKGLESVSQIQSSSQSDFFSLYLDYAGVGNSEAPTIYHRWSCISMIGALLGRQAYLPFGHSNIYPNQYIMLMGSPGARKSTAINIAKSLIREAGYTRFGPDKSSKEQFLSEMKQYDDNDSSIMIEDLEALELDAPSEVYVVAGEFTDFMGQNNMDFVTLLTNLWDCPDEYKNPKRTAKSVNVDRPTVNIIGGNTPQGFALAFPPESMGNGFMSRLILVHGEPTGQLIPWPEASDLLVKTSLASHLKDIKANITGAFTKGKGVDALGSRIYKEAVPVDDNRFIPYGTRRFTHLLKIAMCIAASDLRTEICCDDMLKANTLLYYTEVKMPRALGEFGKSKNAEQANTVLQLLAGASKPVALKRIFRAVSTDISKITELADIIKNLELAGKIQRIMNPVTSEAGYMRLYEEAKEWPKELMYKDWLTEEEMM